MVERDLNRTQITVEAAEAIKKRASSAQIRPTITPDKHA